MLNKTKRKTLNRSEENVRELTKKIREGIIKGSEIDIKNLSEKSGIDRDLILEKLIDIVFKSNRDDISDNVKLFKSDFSDLLEELPEDLTLKEWMEIDLQQFGCTIKKMILSGRASEVLHHIRRS